METNINLRVTAPEIVDAILALAKAVTNTQANPKIQRGGEKMSNLENSEETPKTTSSQGTQNQEQGFISFEKLQSKLIELSRSGRQEQIKAMLNRYGVKRLTQLPRERYEEVLMEVEKW